MPDLNDKELQDLVGFGLDCGELVAGLLDGPGLDDVMKGIKAANEAGVAIKEAPTALKQYLAMTDDQAVALEAYVVKEFDISNDAVEKVIEQALTAVIELHKLASMLIHPKA